LNTPIAGSSRPDGASATVRNTGASGMGSKGTSASSVGLSSAARHLSSLENSDNDVNMERVNQIRDAIASGELKMDPSRIADGLLASVRDLLK
jgi:negative regulator of flagellin synthesis FlgM